MAHTALINEVLPLEECAQVEDLPYAQADQRGNREPGEVLHPAVRGHCDIIMSTLCGNIGGRNENALFVAWKRSSRAFKYSISSTISFTIPSNLRISVSSAESDSWLAMALQDHKH